MNRTVFILLFPLLLAGQRFAELRISRAVCIEIGAHGDDSDRRAICYGRSHQQVIDKRVPLFFGPAQGKQLFKLIDNKQQVGTPCGL
jgi:hypothetical protein